MQADFSSQYYFRNPVAAIEKLRSAGPVIEVRFPIVGRVWTTTTQELTDQVLKDSKTFTLRRDDGNVAGLQWWMPRIVRTLATSMLSMDEPDHTSAADLKFLHHLRRTRPRNFKSKSGTRFNMFASALLVFEVRLRGCRSV